FRRKFVEVLVERIAWIDPVLYSVETSPKDRRECDIGIRRGGRRAKLETLCLGTSGISRNSDSGGTITCRIGKVHRRFESRHEALETVRRWIAKACERGRMFQNSADKKQRHFAEPRVTVAGEQRFAVFPKRNVGVHAGAIVTEQRLRHEGDGLVVPSRDVANDVLVILHRVAHLLQRRETDVDFCLASRSDFMMLFVHGDAGFLDLKRHFVANILQRVHRRNRKIALFRPNLVTEIWKLLAGAIPMSLSAVD